MRPHGSHYSVQQNLGISEGVFGRKSGVISETRLATLIREPLRPALVTNVTYASLLIKP